MKRTAKESGWTSAARALALYHQRPQKVDGLLDAAAETGKDLGPEQRRRTQAQVYAVLRHRILIQSVFSSYVKRTPRPLARAVCELAVAECLEGIWEAAAQLPGVLKDSTQHSLFSINQKHTHHTDNGETVQKSMDVASYQRKVPKVVDFAVSAAKQLLKQPEAGFVNAVLRSALPAMPDLLASLARTGEGDPLKAWPTLFSHPRWLVERWLKRHGSKQTRWLLSWNQLPAPVYIRPGPELEPHTFAAAGMLPFDSPEATGGSGHSRPLYSRPIRGTWPVVAGWLEKGLAIAQDPLARKPLEWIVSGHPLTVLDLCAAPGGKSAVIFWKLFTGAEPNFVDDGGGSQRDGREVRISTMNTGDRAPLLVSVDLPGERAERLRQHPLRQRHLSTATAPRPVRWEVAAADIRELSPEALVSMGLPDTFDAVLIDAPCSNTGVLRRRPDARYRLKPDDPLLCADLQHTLLGKAATLVKPGGRMVYSTCSIEAEENQQVVERFLKESDGNGDFSLLKQKVSLPWIDNHDGGGAYLFHRRAR